MITFHVLSLVVDFYNRISLIYGTVSEVCTDESCPVMSGGPKYVINPFLYLIFPLQFALLLFLPVVYMELEKILITGVLNAFTVYGCRIGDL